MKWKPDTLYKHQNNTDVAIEVIHREQMDNGDWHLVVMWYNIGKCHKPWFLGETQKIVIPNERLPEWEEYHALAT